MSQLFGSLGGLLTSSDTSPSRTSGAAPARTHRTSYKRTSEDYALTELFLLHSLAHTIDALFQATLATSSADSLHAATADLYQVLCILLWHGLKHKGTAAGERNFWEAVQATQGPDRDERLVRCAEAAAADPNARTRHGKCRVWVAQLLSHNLVCTGTRRLCADAELVQETYEAWALMSRQARAVRQGGSALLWTVLSQVEEAELGLAVALHGAQLDTAAPRAPGPALTPRVQDLCKVFSRCFRAMRPPPALAKKASSVLVSGGGSAGDGRYVCVQLDSSGRPQFVNRRSGCRLRFAEGCRWEVVTAEGVALYAAQSTGNEPPRTGWTAVDDSADSRPVLSRFRYSAGFCTLLEESQAAIDKRRLLKDERAALDVLVGQLKNCREKLDSRLSERLGEERVESQSVVVSEVAPALTLTSLHERSDSAAEDKIAGPIKVRSRKNSRLRHSGSIEKKMRKNRRRPQVEILEAHTLAGRQSLGSSTKEIRALAEAMISCSKVQRERIMEDGASIQHEAAENDASTSNSIPVNVPVQGISEAISDTYAEAVIEAQVADALDDIVGKVIAKEHTGIVSSGSGSSTSSEDVDALLPHAPSEHVQQDQALPAELELDYTLEEGQGIETPAVNSPTTLKPFQVSSLSDEKRSAWDEINEAEPAAIDTEDTPKQVSEDAAVLEQTVLELVREYARLEDINGEHAKGLASAIKEITKGYVCGPLLDDVPLVPKECWNVSEVTITGYKVFEDPSGKDAHVRYVIHSIVERVHPRHAGDTSLTSPNESSQGGDHTKTCVVHRRYRDFQDLVREIQAKWKGVQLPPLPKTGFTRKFGSEYLDKKRAGLEDFLYNLLRVECSPAWFTQAMAQDDLVLDFLCKPSTEYTSFLTEDVRKSLTPRPNISEGKQTLRVLLVAIAHWLTLAFQGLHVSLVLERQEELSLQEQEANCCAACGISLRHGGEACFCSYLHKFFCQPCFNGQRTEIHERVIPSTLLHDWSIAKKPVCYLVAEYLDRIYEHPLVCPSGVNPDLFRGESVLVTARRLRLQLVLGREHLACQRKLGEIVPELGGAKRYLYQDTEMYSLSDLEAACSGTLIPLLERAVQAMTAHVETCSLCSANGFACEICHDPNLLYAHELDKVLECRKCKALYHRACLIRVTEEACPQCLRRKDLQST